MAGISQGANGIALDSRGLESLKNTAAKTPEKALRQAAVQFEALFLNQLMRSMRESLPKDGPMHSSATDSYTAMLDQQLAQKMATQGTGLARMIERQLARHVAAVDAKASGDAAALTHQAPARPFATSTQTAPKVEATGDSSSVGQRDFLNRVIEHARVAASGSGVSAVFIAAQAALESGWGRREIRASDGTPANNLFGIKAGKDWTGPTVDVTTTEYVNGAPVKTSGKFRAYPSYAEGLRDYVGLLTRNARYRDVVANGQNAQGFAAGLQRAGYATDPAYADKLARVIQTATRLTRSA